MLSSLESLSPLFAEQPPVVEEIAFHAPGAGVFKIAAAKADVAAITEALRGIEYLGPAPEQTEQPQTAAVFYLRFAGETTYAPALSFAPSGEGFLLTCGARSCLTTAFDWIALYKALPVNEMKLAQS